MTTSNIPSDDAQVTCSRCGEVYQRRYLTGIGSGGRMTWLCGNCVINGGADEAFARIGKQINAAIQAEQEGGSR